jgi:hypothetical protein
MNVLIASPKQYKIAVLFFEFQLTEDYPAGPLSGKMEAILDV